MFKELRESIVELRVNPRAFSRKEVGDNLNDDFECCETYFVGLKFAIPSQDHHASSNHNLRPTIAQFCLLIDMNRIDKQVNDVRVTHYTRSQLS